MGLWEDLRGQVLLGVTLLLALGCLGCAREGTRWIQTQPNRDRRDLAGSPDVDLESPADLRQYDVWNDAALDLGDDSSMQDLDAPSDPFSDGELAEATERGDGPPDDAVDTGDTTLLDLPPHDLSDTTLLDLALDVPSTFADVTLLSVVAPDDTTVVLTFDAQPQDDMSLSQLQLAIVSTAGGVTISKATWESDARSLTLVTGRQKLGILYDLSIGSAGSTTGLLKASFLSADTKVFWATDFDDPDMDDMPLPAHRIFVGQHTVAYSVDGYQFDGVEAACEEFDTLIYPALTESLYEPLDFDGNGKIVLLFTDSDDYGGYFSPVNQWSNLFAMMGGAKSNEMEILYISGWMGSDYFGQVTPHEFQHLLYYSRHLMKENVHWDFHDEGLAESAVRMVYGNNDMASMYYQHDPQNLISMGLSLVNWQWGLYENYALAYVFWAWVAGQLGGVEAYKLIFEIEFGGPEQVSEFLQEHLGMDLHEAVLSMMAAVRVQAPYGIYSFNGMLSLDSNGGPKLPDGTSSALLEPFGGVFVPVVEALSPEVIGKGPNIRVTGIAATGELDSTAPYDCSGGWLLVYNENWSYFDWPSEPTGWLAAGPALLRGVLPRRQVGAVPGANGTSASWDSPPPRNPFRPEQWREWRDARR